MPLSFSLTLLVSALHLDAAWAGPPFVTDDPEPPEYHTWEVNSALIATRVAGTTSGFAPSVDANYGAAPDIQLHFEPQVAFTDGPAGSAYGIGDTEIGVKWRFSGEPHDPTDWMMAIYPLIEIPTGSASRHTGSGASQLFLPLWFQTTRGAWTFYGGGGYWIDHVAGERNSWAGGWTALYQFTDALQLGGEVFTRSALIRGLPASTGFNLGGSYGLAPKLSLLFSAGRGVSAVSETNQGSVYLGLQVIY